MGARVYDAAVIGGGIVGLATARALAFGPKGAAVVVLEAEADIALHQTGRNSGVIHSGLYYRPGSLKARTCVRGRNALYRYCEERGIPFERCGKVVVASAPHELPALDELERRGNANGLAGLRRLGPEGLREVEPHARGVAALHVAETGIVDFPSVARALAAEVLERGGAVRTNCRFLRLGLDGPDLVLETTGGEVRARAVVNCAGLRSDEVARRCGVEPGLRIVPFRGEYYRLAPERRALVRHLIYPVPDPRFPFLGVHFTRRIDGSVEAGPNAVLALAREGYRWLDVSLGEIAGLLRYRGFWRMAFRYGATGIGEAWRSLSRRAFVRALRRLVPEIRAEDLRPGGCGVRAQAVDPSGALVDDFRIAVEGRTLHVLNAPSPAATASLAIGETIAEKTAALLGDR